MQDIEFIMAGFKHADDGIRVIEYKLGRQRVSARCAEVAIREGFARAVAARNPTSAEVSTAAAQPAAEQAQARLGIAGTAAVNTDQQAVEIPANWRDLPWPMRRALAASVSNHPIKTAAEAERAITAALSRRQA